MLAVVVPVAFVLSSVGVPHDTFVDAVGPLEASLVDVSVFELPHAFVEAAPVEVAEVHLSVASGIESDTVALVVLPGAVVDGARAVADPAYAFHEIVEKPAFLNF